MVIFSRCAGLQDIMTTQDPDKHPCLYWAKGVLSGEFTKTRGDKLFGHFLSAMVVLKKKEKRGKGRQNFIHAPEIVEIAHIAAMMSPRCYSFLREFFPMPEIRTLQ